jgi:hypothetical protein
MIVIDICLGRSHDMSCSRLDTSSYKRQMSTGDVYVYQLLKLVNDFSFGCRWEQDERDLAPKTYSVYHLQMNEVVNATPLQGLVQVSSSCP